MRRSLVIAVMLLEAACSSNSLEPHPAIIAEVAESQEDLYFPSDLDKVRLQRFFFISLDEKNGGVANKVPPEPPALRPLRGFKKGNEAHLWLLDGEYGYIYEETCEQVTVPMGFVTDLASIPPMLGERFNPLSYAKAALVHDWLYAIGEDGAR